ncbi:MAG: ribonuclease H-like domain-containing protein [Anaerovoracaceae bacterium]
MKIIEKKVNQVPISYRPLDIFFGNLNCAVFDIETTGLSPKKANLILSGFYIPSPDGNFIYKQIFAESLMEESMVIEETLKVLNSVDYIVTYNGVSFDIPFLEKRMKALNIKGRPMPYNLDIYKLLARHSDLKSLLPNLRQKTIEIYLGYSDSRQDQISGEQSIYEYFDYLETRDPEALEKILLHNRDDVLQLYKLLNILPQLAFFKALCVLGFPLKKVVISNIKLSTKKLELSGSYFGGCSYSAFIDNMGYTYDFSCETEEFSVKIDLATIQGVTFVDLNKLNLDLSAFESIDGYYQGNLVLSKEKAPNYQGIAIFTKHFVEEIIINEL